MRKPIVIVVAMVMVVLAGCASGPVMVSAQATGGPAVAGKLWEDIKSMGSLKTTPGGFIIRPENAFLGAIINDDQEEKDVYVYVRKRRPDAPEGHWQWALYQGPAMVKTPKGWMSVTGLEAIHFESAFLQQVTIRTLESGETKEIKFDTFGRRDAGSYYQRINILMIILPPDEYKFQVFRHSGKWIFKRAEGYPHTRHLYLSRHKNAARENLNGYWIGWKIVL